jgi:hypothetical protein
MNQALNVTAGYTFAASPASDPFKNSLTKLSLNELVDMLKGLQKNPLGHESEINALIDELLNRKKSALQSQFSEGDTGAGIDLQTLMRLMSKLKNHTITDDEMNTLALLLGLDPALLTLAKDASQEGDHGGGDSH